MAIHIGSAGLVSRRVFVRFSEKTLQNVDFCNKYLRNPEKKCIFAAELESLYRKTER